jgi:16S rRNA (cytidine1402-2'-O)-methyltransferase
MPRDRREKTIGREIQSKSGLETRPPDGGALAPGLYLVATPIGHLADITLRAIDVLKRADLVACEDTRVTGRLLSHYGIATPTLPYHDHNAERARPELLAHLAEGARVALVSDAGSPLVADPGYKLVRAAAAAGIPVTSVPGPSAAIAALQLSGLPSDRFLFAGFLPAAAGARREALAGLAGAPATLLFFETAPRLADSLTDMAAALGDRPAAVARELTKYFEEVRRDGLAALARHYAEAGPPKGEIAVVVGPPAADATRIDDAEIDRRLDRALETMSARDAAALVAAEAGLGRRAVYQRAIARAARRRP